MLVYAKDILRIKEREKSEKNEEEKIVFWLYSYVY